MVRRAVLLALLVLAACDDGRPVAVVGHAVTTTTLTTTSTAPSPASTSTTTTAPRRTVATSRTTTVVRPDGVTIVNEGSAVADTGGNVVIGPPDATVVNGPATAVGNVSRP